MSPAETGAYQSKVTLPAEANLPKRKRPRLAPASYAQPGAICSVTIAVRDRRPVFGQPEVAVAAIDVVRCLAKDTGVPVYGYCVMPDHVHLVLAPSDACDIVTFVARFKNLTLRAARTHGIQGSSWQKSFWDHFLRADEGLQRVVEYVLNNPVRRGLAPAWRQYPYCGSLVFDL